MIFNYSVLLNDILNILRTVMFGFVVCNFYCLSFFDMITYKYVNSFLSFKTLLQRFEALVVKTLSFCFGFDL